jgi:chromosome segregation ATPase
MKAFAVAPRGLVMADENTILTAIAAVVASAGTLFGGAWAIFGKRQDGQITQLTTYYDDLVAEVKSLRIESKERDEKLNCLLDLKRELESKIELLEQSNRLHEARNELLEKELYEVKAERDEVCLKLKELSAKVTSLDEKSEAIS